MIFETILPFVDKYGIMIAFLGGFITGESVIITLGFLSANNVLALWKVLIFSTLGMYFSDFIPFTIGRLRFLKKILGNKWLSNKTKRAEESLQKYTKNNIFLMLLFTKFIYGASIPALIYLGYKRISYLKFAFYDFLVVLIFVPIVITIGYLSGKGFRIAVMIFDNLRIAIFLLIIFILLFIIIRKWLNMKLIKEQEK
ncbi:MAG: VTT domain-containing protein [Nanoarchaeota archaeon]|nr:VTT domain-containing protein [Nanoarchaeota archaeon]